MSDIKKLLDILSEMATTSGSVATVSQPLGPTRTRAKGDAGVYSEQTDESEKTDEEKSDDVTNGVKTPANFGLWQNSYHQAETQKKRKAKKKSVAESRHSEEHSELDSPEMQEIMARMKKRYEADPRTKDSKKFTDDLARRLRAAEKSQRKDKKLDELGNSLMPGGQRSLKLAEENLEEADLIINPYELSRSKSRDIFMRDGKADHEISMARSDLLQCIKNSEAVLELISVLRDTDNLPGWVQEKIVKAADYLNTVAEFLEGRMADIVANQRRVLNQQTGWQNQPTEYEEGYTSGQPAIQREGEDLSWDDPDLVALRRRRPEFRSRTHPELDEPKKSSSRIRSIKRDGHTEFKGIDREIARQRKSGKLKEDSSRGWLVVGTDDNGTGFVYGRTSDQDRALDLFDKARHDSRLSTDIRRTLKVVPLTEPELDKSKYVMKQEMTEGQYDNPVASAITNRILVARTDLLEKYGPVYVSQAIDDVVDRVGDVDEIGTSDVSIWVSEVERNLRDNLNQYDEPMSDIDLLESSGQFKTREEAVKYARERVKTFSDSLDGIEIYQMPDGGFSVVHTMNSNGRDAVMDRGGKKIGTVRAKSDVNEEQQDPNLARAYRMGNAAYLGNNRDALKTVPREYREMWIRGWNEAESFAKKRMMSESKKDACYRKVKSRYKVWPSAYASGALVKCRKVGAKNWGNKSKK